MTKHNSRIPLLALAIATSTIPACNNTKKGIQIEQQANECCESVDFKGIVAYVSPSNGIAWTVRGLQDSIREECAWVGNTNDIFESSETLQEFAMTMTPVDGDRIVIQGADCRTQSFCGCAPYSTPNLYAASPMVEPILFGKCKQNPNLPPNVICVMEYGPVCRRKIYSDPNCTRELGDAGMFRTFRCTRQ